MHRKFIIAALAVSAGVTLPLIALLPSPAAATPAGDETSFDNAWMTDSTTTIDLTADITLSCVGGTPIRSVTAGPLTVDGHGHTITQTCTGDGVLQADGTASITLMNVSITGGTNGGSGGGIKEHGPLVLTNSVVHDNTAGSTGGGISALAPLGSVTLTNSTVRNNSSAAGDGGIETAGTATLTDSTVDHNTATGGSGGISAVGGVTLVRSTISNNSATAGGGGIGAASIMSTNSTISNNTAGLAGGGGFTTTSATLAYTTIVQNASPLGANLLTRTLSSFATVVALPLGGGANCVASSPASSGFNFSDDSSCGFTLASDRQNAGNPNVGALAGNGGPTQTRLPQTGSPLIDAISNTSCQTAPLGSGIVTDQRILPRPSPPGGACDIGSVEVQVASPTAPIVVAPRFTG